jgi:hypothetical protein
MNERDASTFAPTRRRVLHAAGVAALAGWPSLDAFGLAPTAAMPNSPARIDFQSSRAAAAALAQPDDPYFANMGLLEIRARMRSPLTDLSLAAARAAVREYDAGAVLEFTGQEKIAIGGVIHRMQALLEARAPLYARTPWSFIKLDDRAEGGMPHTRGSHIVLPKETAEHFAVMHQEMLEAGKLAVTPRGRDLLIHEQTHVLERQDPARFEPLFTGVFGFARMTPAPATAWLSEHRCTNPDGPDVAWAFPLAKIGGSGWLMPDVALPDMAVPRMPEDFQAIGVEVIQAAEGWKIVEENGRPRRRDLDKIPGYDAHFPFPDEDFHPNEIAAVALAHWILQDVPDVNSRPLMPALAEWAKKALA